MPALIKPNYEPHRYRFRCSKEQDAIVITNSKYVIGVCPLFGTDQPEPEFPKQIHRERFFGLQDNIDALQKFWDGWRKVIEAQQFMEAAA